MANLINGICFGISMALLATAVLVSSGTPLWVKLAVSGAVASASSLYLTARTSQSK